MGRYSGGRSPRVIPRWLSSGSGGRNPVLGKGYGNKPCKQNTCGRRKFPCAAAPCLTPGFTSSFRNPSDMVHMYKWEPLGDVDSAYQTPIRVMRWPEYSREPLEGLMGLADGKASIWCRMPMDVSPDAPGDWNRSPAFPSGRYLIASRFGSADHTLRWLLVQTRLYGLATVRGAKIPQSNEREAWCGTSLK